MSAGFSTGSPSRAASSATSDSASARPRPFGRSGCVTTATTSQVRATARSAGTAKSGVPMNTTRGRLRTGLPAPPRSTGGW